MKFLKQYGDKQFSLPAVPVPEIDKVSNSFIVYGPLRSDTMDRFKILCKYEIADLDKTFKKFHMYGFVY